MSEDNERIEAIRARRAAITPGRWLYDKYAEKVYDRQEDDGQENVICDLGGWDQHDTDGFFIASAPADIDFLLAEVDTLTNDLEDRKVNETHWRAEADALRPENEALKQEVAQLERENAALREEVATVRANSTRLHSIIENYRAELEEIIGPEHAPSDDVGDFTR